MALWFPTGKCVNEIEPEDFAALVQTELEKLPEKQRVGLRKVFLNTDVFYALLPGQILWLETMLGRILVSEPDMAEDGFGLG